MKIIQELEDYFMVEINKKIKYICKLCDMDFRLYKKQEQILLHLKDKHKKFDYNLLK